MKICTYRPSRGAPPLAQHYTKGLPALRSAAIEVASMADFTIANPSHSNYAGLLNDCDHLRSLLPSTPYNRTHHK